MGYSGAGGKLIHEKNQKQKISWHCPFKKILQTLKTVNAPLSSGRPTRVKILVVRHMDAAQYCIGNRMSKRRIFYRRNKTNIHSLDWYLYVDQTLGQLNRYFA